MRTAQITCAWRRRESGELPPAAASRLDRRTARTFPLFPPPQKNHSPPIGLEPGYAGSGRHLEPLQHPSRARITPHPSGLSVGDPELHRRTLLPVNIA